MKITFRNTEVWHKHFVFFPVWVSDFNGYGEYRYLEYVYRKNTKNLAGSSWSYKAITKENEDEN